MSKKQKTNKKELLEPVGKIGDVSIWCNFDELIDIEALQPNPRNPNTHSEEQINRLAIIIKYQGWRSPIVVSTRSGFIVKGHARLSAAQELNLSKCPVEYQDYENEASEWADLIADNVIAELAQIDGLKMADLINEIDTANFNLDLTGLNKEQIENYINGPSFQPSTDDPARLDQLEPIMTKCPECGKEFDARKNKIIN